LMLGNLNGFGSYLGLSFFYTNDNFPGFEGKFGFYLMNFEDLLNGSNYYYFLDNYPNESYSFDNNSFDVYFPNSFDYRSV